MPPFASSCEPVLLEYFLLKRHPIAAACALLVAAAAPAFAQDGPPGEGQPRAGAKLERVEISSRPATDTDLRRKSPVAKQIYGREELDKFGDTNVADVLKRLPGVNMAGGAPRMRGLGSGYTLILINGDPAPPGFDLSQLDPAQVERIEITKGPTADQSAQAVAGAINIILKDAPKVTQRDLRLGTSYSAVRPGASGSFTYGSRQGGLSYSLPISVFGWRGLNESTTTRAVNEAGSDWTVTQAQEQAFWGAGWNATPRLNWKIDDEQSLNLTSFLQQGRWHFNTRFADLGETGSGALPDSDTRNLGTWQMVRANGQYTNQLNDSQRLELKAGLQDARGSFHNDTFATPFRNSDGDNTDRNFTQGGKFSQIVNDQHSVTGGWELEWRRREETRTVRVGGQEQLPGVDGAPFAADINRRAFFVQDEWEISPQWSAYVGLRTERIRTETATEDGTKFGNTSSVTTPLLHLNYKIDPKGRDLIRASLTRSYKAPTLNQLLSRPALSGLYPDPTTANTDISPDNIGNPNLKPELATGLDVAYEKYLQGGGMVSVGGFYRRVSNLIRNVVSLEQPGEAMYWSDVARWVNRPVNFSTATAMGLELELKGRAGELMPSLFDPKLPLNLRAALNVYHSRVAAVPGPNNRLDAQQPWSANLGFDYRTTAVPMNLGASFAYTPGYLTQQTSMQASELSRTRSLDLFAQYFLSKTSSIRVSANNFAPVDTQTLAMTAGGYTFTDRKARTQFGLNWETKL